MPKQRREHTHWGTNELALIIYAIYKGASTRQIAAIFGTSRASISMQLTKIRHSESYSPKMQKKINKAELLEMKVRSGDAPDHREVWDERITKFTGIEYSYKDKTPEEEPEEKQEEVENNESLDSSLPLFQLTINTQPIIAVINAWRKVK